MKGAKRWKKKVEKTLKNFQKGIDNRKRLWYNNKVAARKRDKRSLKIEQQEISTKQKSKCANLVEEELYILNKVKEAKIK